MFRGFLRVHIFSKTTLWSFIGQITVIWDTFFIEILKACNTFFGFQRCFMFPYIVVHIKKVHIRLLSQVLLQRYGPLRWDVLFRSISINFFSNAYFGLFSLIILNVCKILRTVIITRLNISKIMLEIVCNLICHLMCQCHLLAYIHLILDSNMSIDS